MKQKTPSLADLLVQVKSLTSKFGAKAALARELKVSRQAVNSWLNGDTKPTAETALELLNWVEQQKRK